MLIRQDHNLRVINATLGFEFGPAVSSIVGVRCWERRVSRGVNLSSPSGRGRWYATPPLPCFCVCCCCSAASAVLPTGSICRSTASHSVSARTCAHLHCGTLRWHMAWIVSVLSVPFVSLFSPPPSSCGTGSLLCVYICVLVSYCVLRTLVSPSCLVYNVSVWDYSPLLVFTAAADATTPRSPLPLLGIQIAIHSLSLCCPWQSTRKTKAKFGRGFLTRLHEAYFCLGWVDLFIVSPFGALYHVIWHGYCLCVPMLVKT